MLSIISEYVSLALQVAAAIIAISLFKRTKFNVSWILISSGFLLMTLSRVFELWPTIEPESEEQMVVIQRWLDFVISLVLLIGVFYIRKIFLFMRRLDQIRRETEKRVLSAVIRTEEQERQRFAKELHDGLGPLLSVVKMLLSGAKAVEVCTAVIQHGFSAITSINQFISEWMERHGYNDTASFIGLLSQEHIDDGWKWERTQFLKTIN